MILAIDTTSAFGSIALATAAGDSIEELTIHAPDGFGQILFDRIRGLLDGHGTGVEAITRLAVASGPGSFTGVRVGLTAAKGLAEALGRPVVPVSNLAAIASFGTRPVRAAFRDARRGEVYGGVYDSTLVPVAGEVVSRFEDWLAGIPADAEIVAVESAPFDAVLAGRPVTSAPRALAAAIARIAAQSTGSDAAALDASYVRRSDAEMLWKDR